MRDLIINKIVNKLKEYKKYSNIEIIKIRYGLEGFIRFLEKIVIILIIGIFLNLLKEMLIFMFFYMIIKLNSGGAHAKNSFWCLIFSLIIFIGIPYLGKATIINTAFKLIVLFISVFIFYKYSPASTHKKPIIYNKNKLKRNSILILIIYCISSLFLKNYIGNILILSVITQAFFIMPISYKIFNVPYIK